MIRTYFVLVLTSFLYCFLLTIEAFALSGEQVMQNVYDQSRLHKNQQAEVKLIIINREGSERQRYFKFLYKILPERTKSLIKFFQPPSVRGTGLLSENENGSDDTQQWIYLPALNSVKKLSQDDRHKSFMGSDFTNADIAGRQISQDRHKIKGDDGKIIIIHSTPKDRSDPYGLIETHVLKNINVPKKVIFYNHKRQKIKSLTNQALLKVKGMYAVMQSVMDNHRSGGKTRLIKNDFEVDRVIDVNEVGFKGLKR